MRCGARCFTVELEAEDYKKSITVTARSSVEARKAISLEYGKAVTILSVRLENNRK